MTLSRPSRMQDWPPLGFVFQLSFEYLLCQLWGCGRNDSFSSSEALGRERPT